MKDWPWYGHIILAVIVFALLYFVYFKSQNNKLAALTDEREKTEAEVTNLKKKNLQLSRIEEELVDLRKILNELEAIIPKRKELASIINQIHQLAINSRLNIAKFQPRGEVDMEFYYEWPIAIEVTGNYHNLATFFDHLSNFSRLFNVEDFSIKSVGKQTDTTTISAAYTAKTYIFREEALPAEGSR
jgi:Tfp pilus assembly protein PilO